MQTYKIEKQTGAPNWGSVPSARIDRFNWNCAYQPLSFAQLVLLDGNRLAVRMRSYEKDPVSKCDTLDGPTYKDSCLEFFINPFPEQTEFYVNFECNHKGCLFINYGGQKGKFERHTITGLGLRHPEVACFSGKDENGKFWGVEYEVPLHFFETIYGSPLPVENHPMRGNFYKCGDETGHPHFGSWTEIDYPTPNFHLPAFFGCLQFDD